MIFAIFCYVKCSKNYKCNKHFLQIKDITPKLLNNYKLVLLLQNKIPVELIDIIIYQYVDNRPKCFNCNFKFTLSIRNYDFCNNCNNYMCKNIECKNKHKKLYNDDSSSDDYNSDDYNSDDYNRDDYNRDDNL